MARTRTPAASSGKRAKVNRGGSAQAKARTVSMSDLRVERSRPEGLRTEYANNVSLSMTPWDFLLSFGRIKDVTEDRLAYDEVASLYMSPAHVKAFVRLLVNQVRQYEAQYGEIREPAPPAEPTAGKAN